MTTQQIEEEILHLIDCQDDYTRSELQGIVEALAMTLATK